ncbi:MAG: glycosyltransferase family 2 protein [Eubacteriaceae bacterium]
MNKMISVIVLVYNMENYLNECLKSISIQTYSNFEVILVDDGSSDNSGAVCDLFAKNDKRFKVIHRENGGVSIARNTGLKAAKGRYVCFVDSDDWIRKELLEELINLLEKYCADIAECCFFTEKNDCLYEKEKVHCYSKHEYMIELLERTIDSYICGKLYKRELFNNNAFPIGKTLEDMLIMPEIIKKTSRIIKTNQKYYYYRTRLDSITRHSDYELRNHTALAEAFRLRYYIAQDEYKEAEDIALKNATIYSIHICRVLRDEEKTNEQFKEEYQKNYQFIKKNFSKIMTNRKVPICYKLATFLTQYFPKLFCISVGMMIKLKSKVICIFGKI